MNADDDREKRFTDSINSRIVSAFAIQKIYVSLNETGNTCSGGRVKVLRLPLENCRMKASPLMQQKGNGNSSLAVIQFAEGMQFHQQSDGDDVHCLALFASHPNETPLIALNSPSSSLRFGGNALSHIIHWACASLRGSATMERNQRTGEIHSTLRRRHRRPIRNVQQNCRDLLH